MSFPAVGTQALCETCIGNMFKLQINSDPFSSIFCHLWPASTTRTFLHLSAGLVLAQLNPGQLSHKTRLLSCEARSSRQIHVISESSLLFGNG